MICLIYKETFLVDRLLRVTEEKFVREGGFRENLFKKRREFKKGK
jgi:four helix bundle suffix protein